MNFYEILGLDNGASKSEIKKAFRELTIKYHPDKSSDPDCKEKFQEIKAAYEILYNDEKRNHYDSMTNEEKSELFDLIKHYFKDIRPQYGYIYDMILTYVYLDQERDFEKDINSFDFKSILIKIRDKINSSIKRKEIEVIDIDTETFNLYISIEDRYKNGYKNVRVISKQNNEYLVPLYPNEYIINDPEKGKINIKIICENNTNFQVIDEHDLFYTKKVSLSQYIYGGIIKIQSLDGEIIKFELESCLEKKPVFILEKKGLPKENNERGNLYIYIVVEGINSPEIDELAHNYSRTVEETLKLMFPSID